MHQHSSESRPPSGWTKFEAISASYGFPPFPPFPGGRPDLWPDVASDSPAARMFPGINLDPRMILRPNVVAGPAPYTEEEDRAIHRWGEAAWARSYSPRALAMVALCRGAGADADVLCSVKGGHVYRWGDFLVVHAPNRRHPVAVDCTWAPVIERLAGDAGPEGYLVCSQDGGGLDPSFLPAIADAAQTLAGFPPSLDCERLRATWIVHHLRCGTDAAVLLRVAGFSGFDALDPYLDFVEWPGDDEAFRSLRGDW